MGTTNGGKVYELQGQISKMVGGRNEGGRLIVGWGISKTKVPNLLYSQRCGPSYVKQGG